MPASDWDPEPTIRRTVPVPTVTRPARRPDRLMLRFEGQDDKILQLDREETVIGRSDGCHIRVQSPTVSRRHAVIVKRGHELRIRDLDSHNGVLVNQVKVHSAVLCDGDQIQIGDATFEYHRGTA